MEKLVWLIEQAVMADHMDIGEVYMFVKDVADRHGYAIDVVLLGSLHNAWWGSDDLGRTADQQQARLLAQCPSVLGTNTDLY